MIAAIVSSGIPWEYNICSNLILSIESNTLMKLTKSNVALRFLALIPFINRLMVRICPVVERSFRNPF